jgi:hypothetical protein
VKSGLSTPLIQLALHAQEPGLVGLMIRVHGSFLRLRLPIGSLLAFAMWPAFPTSDYYASSVPLTPHPRSPRIARVRHGRGITGSHVPIPDLRSLGGVLYPWRLRTMAEGGNPSSSALARTLQKGTSNPTGSHHGTRHEDGVSLCTEASNARFVVSP